MGPNHFLFTLFHSEAAFSWPTHRRILPEHFHGCCLTVIWRLNNNHLQDVSSMKYGFSLNLRKAREAPKQIHTTKWFQCLHYPKYNSQSFGVMLVAACSQQTFQCISTVWSGASRVLFMTKKLNSVEFPVIRGSQGLILTSPHPHPPEPQMILLSSSLQLNSTHCCLVV